MSDRTKLFCGFAVFLLAYLALRVFWLTGDPGIPSVWEYGYNATDEGYYLGGGKEKFLWGCFVDLPRTEVFTYGFSPLTHWLSYLAHLAFGLSTWTWRIPFVLIYALAWAAVYFHVARRAGAGNALGLCLATSCMPMLIAYERTASNDVLIGSLLVLAYVIGAGAAKWRLFAAAVVAGAIVLVKPSVWALLPIALAGVLETPKFRKPWQDVAAFLAAAVASVFCWKALGAYAALPDAQKAGVTVWEIVRRTTTHYPLPPLFDFASHFKGLSAFPRDPSYALMGVATAFVFALPAVMAMRGLYLRRWNARTLLFFAVPAYVAAVNVMNTQYTHYFIPALMTLPFLLAATMEELSADSTDGAFRWKRLACVAGGVALVCALIVACLLNAQTPAKEAQQFYSRVYNFPAKNVWGLTGGAMAGFVALVVAFAAALRGLKAARVQAVFWALAAFAAASSVFAAWPAVQLAPYMRGYVDLSFAPMCLCLVVSAVLAVVAFGCAEAVPWRKALAPFFVACMALCCVVAPSWRRSACELVKPPAHRHAEVAKELKALLPPDAVVIGERSNQMLMSLPIRTATTFAANSDPIPVIKSVLAAEPQAKLYALADTQHAYNLQHYREHAREYALQLVKTFKMPSFATGADSDVHLCRIVPLPPAPAK